MSKSSWIYRLPYKCPMQILKCRECHHRLRILPGKCSEKLPQRSWKFATDYRPVREINFSNADIDAPPCWIAHRHRPRIETIVVGYRMCEPAPFENRLLVMEPRLGLVSENILESTALVIFQRVKYHSSVDLLLTNFTMRLLPARILCGSLTSDEHDFVI